MALYAILNFLWLLSCIVVFINLLQVYIPALVSYFQTVYLGYKHHAIIQVAIHSPSKLNCMAVYK